MVVDVVGTLSMFLTSNSQQQKEEFQQAIDKFSRESILKAIPDIIHSNAAPNLIRLIFEGLANGTQSRNNLMLHVMKAVVTELCDSEAVPESCVVDIVHIISIKSHELSSSDLAELVQLCLSFIQSGNNLKGKWLSVFPMLFSELSKQNRVSVDKESMTGVEFCEEIVTTLCNTKVATEDAVAFTGILRELKIPSNSMSRFVAKLCAIIPEMEPQEIPPFVYQLLFLCDQSDHLVPLEHLATYFQTKLRRYNQNEPASNTTGDSMEIDSDIIESGSLKEILQAKATSIFHISRAAATGHPLGKEFLKFIRNRRNIPELVLVPFILEVALSLGGLPQLRDVIELLRTVIQSCLSSNEKQRHSAWMREIMLSKCLNVQEMLGTIMQQSASEGDNIFKGLELLAFSLLEIKNPGLPGRASSSGSNTVVGNSSNLSGVVSSPSQQCWNIGSNILLQMIKKFPDSAPLIVQKLVERLQDVNNDSQYISTISLMVQHNPLSMLECKVSITSLLYSMDYRGVPSAKRLYSGISPLFRSSGALRDSAFVVLRKLLHSCSEDARQVAVVGFLQILKNFRFHPHSLNSSLSQTSMSSQATVDVHHSQTSNTNRAFCSELIKLLQCSLSQQSVVRLTLYQSLPEVISRNPELLPECIKMLRCHLKFFVDPEGSVQTDMCVAKDGISSHIVEPLGQLIQAILQTILRSGKVDYLKKDDIDARSEDQVDLGVFLLRKLVINMAQSSVDEFVLGDPQELHTQLKIQVLSSVCVALADSCLAQNATSSMQAAKYLSEIYEKHVHFELAYAEIIGKNKGKGKAVKSVKGKGKDNAVDGSPHKDDAPNKIARKTIDTCSLSLQNIALFLNFLDESNPAARNEEVVTYFKSTQLSKLRRWIIQSACTKFQTFHNSGDIEGLTSESIAKFSGSVGRGLLYHCLNAKQTREEQAIEIYCLSLNCLSEMIHAFCKHQPSKLSRLLMALDGVENSSSSILEHQVIKSLEHFKGLLNHLLSGRENEDLVVRAVVPVVGVLTVLSDQLDPAGVPYSDLLEWTVKLCRDVECTESSIVKVLMSFLLHLSMTAESSPTILGELAKEVRLAIGPLSEESSVATEPNKFSTVNDDTASVVLSVLISKLEQLLQVVEWAMPRIGVIERGDASPMVERSIYARLKLISHAVSELVLADIRPGPSSEMILKLATSLYTTMGRVTKRQTKTILPVFRSLVRVIATQLTANLNTFIMHLDGKERLAEKGLKRKRGDKETGAPKLLKSARSIPALTFASEQYSQAILAVSKRTKEDLSFGFKLGTTRDFRIKADKVHEALEDGEAHSSSSSNSDSENEIEANNSRNVTSNSEIRLRGTARRSRGRGRGKFTSAGKATALTN